MQKSDVFEQTGDDALQPAEALVKETFGLVEKAPMLSHAFEDAIGDASVHALGDDSA